MKNITTEDTKNTEPCVKTLLSLSGYIQFKDILDDIAILPEEILVPIKSVIKAFANKEREKANKSTVIYPILTIMIRMY